MGLKERISKKKELVVREDKQLSISPTPEMLIQQAIDQKVPIETMEKLMAMRRELREEEARGAYYRDLAAFQAECPVIGKNKSVTDKEEKGGKERYRYASLDEIVVQVAPFLSRHGFSYTFKNKQTDTAYTAICIPMHRDGHSESTEFVVPVDLKAYMSAPQKVGSARSFANRYAFCNAFGVQTGEDNDAQNIDDIPEKKDPPPPPEKTKEYLKLEKQILRNVGSKCFKGPIDFRGNPVDLDVIRNQAQEYLPKKVHSMERIKDTAIKVAEMLEIALKPETTAPPKDEVVIEKPEVVEEKEKPPVKSTEYLEIEARIIKDILHPEFIGKVLFAGDDGKTQEVDLGHYKRKMPDILAKNVCTMEELEKKADVVARLLLAATTKHEKFNVPDPKPAGMVVTEERGVTVTTKSFLDPSAPSKGNPEFASPPPGVGENQGSVPADMEPKKEGQGTFDGFDDPASREGNAVDGGGE